MPVSFSTDASGWQYAAVALVAEKDYSSVEVGTSYNYGANTVYFDGIQFYRETFGTSYTYNADGTVESVVDLQNKMTEYQYDDNGNLTQIMQDGTAKMTYDYDNYHNVISATTEEGLSYAFTYDGWGNNTTVTIVNNGVSITSKAFYTENGNFLSYVKDALGNKTGDGSPS